MTSPHRPATPVRTTLAASTALALLIGLVFVVTAPPAAAQGPCTGGQYTIAQLERDPYSDWDRDGVPNYGEWLNGTSPCAHPCAYLTNADLQANPYGDWDGDGWGNRYEVQQGMSPCDYTTVVPAGSVVSPAPAPAPRPTPRPPAPTPVPRPTSTPAPTPTPLPTATPEKLVIDFVQLRSDIEAAETVTPVPTLTAVPTAAPTSTPAPTSEPFDFDSWAGDDDGGEAASPADNPNADDGEGAGSDDGENETAGGFVLDVDAPCVGLDVDGQCLRWTHLSLVLVGAGLLLGGAWMFESRRRMRDRPSFTLVD